MHLLQVVQSSDIASSQASPARSEQILATGPGVRIPTIGSVDLAIGSALAETSSILYYLQDLPIIINISPSMIYCILLVGAVDYIVDLKEVEAGQLLVRECEEVETVLEDLRVDVRELSSSPKRLRGDTASQNVTFHVHDAKQHELQFSMTWVGH